MILLTMKKTLILIQILISIIVINLNAQSYLTRDIPEEKLTVGFRTIYGESSMIHKNGLITDFKADLNLGNRWIVSASVPWLFLPLETYASSGSDFVSMTSFGNMELSGGLLLGKKQNSLLSFSAFLPIYGRDEDAYLLMDMGANTNRYEIAKYQYDYIALKANIHFENDESRKWMLAGEFGPQAFISYDRDRDEMLALNFSLRCGYRFTTFVPFAEMGGILGNRSFLNNSLFYNIGGQFVTGTFRPGFYAGNNIGGLYGLLSFGLKLDVVID